MTESSALTALLDQDLAYEAKTRNGLSSHLPMALIALSQLGATDRRLHDFFDKYVERLDPLSDAISPLIPEDWMAATGTEIRYRDLFDFFRGQIAVEGPTAVLAANLPRLVAGIPSAAFHGVIRLAYEVEAGRPAGIASGLAYLADTYKEMAAADFDAVERGESEDDPAALLASLRTDEYFANIAFEGSSVTARINQVVGESRLGQLAGRLTLDDSTFDAIARTALDLYASHSDFTSLHAVTGTHAVRVLSPYFGDPAVLSRCLFQAIAAAYTTMARPEFSADRDITTPHVSWTDIAAAATKSNDEHVIKFAFTCREEHAHRGGNLYLAMAAEKVGLA